MYFTKSLDNDNNLNSKEMTTEQKLAIAEKALRDILEIDTESTERYVAEADSIALEAIAIIETA